MTEGERVARAAWAALDAGLSGDPDAAARCLEPDVVFLGSGEGEEAVGIEAIGPMLAAIGPHAAGGTFDVAWDELDARVEGDLAFVTGFGTTRATGSMAKFDGTRYRLTGVLVRRDGDWRWWSFHGSEPSGW